MIIAINAVLFVLALTVLMRTLYRLGYAQGRRDQIYEDSENFLRSMRRHTKNKADEQ